MKKLSVLISIIFVTLALLAGCAGSSAEEVVSALHVDNGALCDESGEPIQLKGVSTHAITRVEMLINDDLFREMHEDWGVNVVRLAMYTLSNDGYTYSDYYKEHSIELMKKGIDLAIENNMYVICDWHILQDGNPNQFKAEAIEFFDMMSSEYADCNNVIYEICNEPNGCEWSDIKAYAKEVIPVIRKNSPNAVILCGTPEWSQRVDEAVADPLDFDNVMYSLHFYAATHKDDLRNRLITCAEAGLPIFVTEYGVCASNGGHPRDFEQSDLWMEALDEYQISSCIWCLAKNGEACALINSSSTKTSEYTEDDFSETGTWFLEMLGK